MMTGTTMITRIPSPLTLRRCRMPYPRPWTSTKSSSCKTLGGNPTTSMTFTDLKTFVTMSTRTISGSLPSIRRKDPSWLRKHGSLAC
eukprot:8389758-Heterocapsa_arctica.AAC.1